MLRLLMISSVALWSIVLVNLLLTIALIRRSNQSDFPEIKTGPKTGSAAPDFRAEAITGETITLANYARKAVSFIFFSPDCGSCVEKLPEIHAIAAEANQAGVELVLVNTGGNRAATAAFVDQHNVRLPILVAPMESNPFANDYNVNMTPFYCLLNSESHVESTGFLDSGWERNLLRVGAIA